MEWEIQWIKNNQHYYDSELHANSVIQNIKKRYKIIQLSNELKGCKKILDGV